MLRGFAFALFILMLRPESSAPAAQNSPASQKNDDETYFHQALKPDVLPVWVGGFAALIASFVGVKTLGKIREQAEAAVVAANAAKKSADAQINIERPWLLIEGLDLPCHIRVDLYQMGPRTLTGALKYTIINYGKTPARVRTLCVRIAKGSSPDLPPDASEVYAVPDFAVNAHIIPQGQDRPDEVRLHKGEGFTDGEDREIAASKLFVWVMGVVRYEDVHGGYYETRICYRWNATKQELSLAGPPEYNNAK